MVSHSIKILTLLVCCILIVAAGATQERKPYGKNVFLQGLPKSILHDGENVSRHNRTQNSYSIRGWNHDGDALLFSYRGGLYELRRRGGDYRKIFDFSDIEIRRPQKVEICDKPGFVFVDDSDGDEYFALHKIEVGSFKPEKISAGKATTRGIRISNAKDRVVYSSSQANSGVWQLFAQSLCGASDPNLLYTGADNFFADDFHPNDTHILARIATDEGYKLSEFDLVTGQENVLIEQDRRIDQAAYSADGRYVFYTSNQEADFIELNRLDLETKELIPVLANIGMDIDGFTQSADRTRMAVILNQSGLSKIVVLDTEALALMAPPTKKSLGVISFVSFSPDNQSLAITLSQPMVPRRSGIYDIATGEIEMWTGGFVPHKKLHRLIPNITTYPTFDMDGDEARQIPTLVYKPSNASAESPAPVLIIAHGGPASQSRPQYRRFDNYIVTRMGIAVLRPNIRGSTGYGVEFSYLDQGKKREDSIKDIGALLDWIETQPDLDASRVMISGGSYGGYVSLASLAMYPDRLKAGVSRVGITDFETFLQNTESYRVNNRRREYGDERDPEMAAFFKEISPLHNAHKIKSPVLIIQGANDPRVPQQQAEDMITAIRENDVDVSYLLAMNEGHGFSDPKNARLATGAQVYFMRKHLLQD